MKQIIEYDRTKVIAPYYFSEKWEQTFDDDDDGDDDDWRRWWWWW